MLNNIGRHSYGEPNIIKYNNSSNLYIGNFCSIANSSIIYLGGEHRTNLVSTFPFNVFDQWDYIDDKQHPYSKGDVIIENDVWICGHSIILSGVKMRNGSVLGAGSVLTRDTEPYGIYAGNPARLIKKRFSEDVIDKLLMIKWWEWSDEKINKNIELMNNVNKFIEKYANTNTTTK